MPTRWTPSVQRGWGRLAWINLILVRREVIVNALDSLYIDESTTEIWLVLPIGKNSVH